MSSSRLCSLLSAGWVCIGLVLGGSGCELTLAMGERNNPSSQTASIMPKQEVSASKQDYTPSNLLPVSYQQVPGGMTAVQIRLRGLAKFVLDPC